ncbi:hypothetical protein RUM44_003411 [Polyplax serrata]|uniref:Uncharacterized protein n=1 Tax=Polyplax serrata TaxID=468196 RepID=A0ABR1AHS2_POLSC
MTDASHKPSHKEWRRAAKKARRKKIRQSLAELRKTREKELENSPSYRLQLEKERLLEEYELEREAKEREERYLKWLEDEKEAQKRWNEEQRLKALADAERLKEQQRIRNEWEIEQKKIREQKERLEKLKKEETKRREETLERINNFIVNGGDVPIELQCVTETHPGKEICSFFYKVGACRFGSQCSRNHQHLHISNTLMISNFYSHFTLDQCKSSEYDTDIGLEYEDSDMYSHFREFYLDVIPEFKRFGDVTMVKICCNSEPHLRGNVYIEYKDERDAMVAYRGFQGRWYGGKQLTIEFVKIRDWGGAVCGDFARKKCPKGKSCNFLHVFRNPRNEFAIEWSKNKSHTHTSARSSFDDDFEKNSRKRNWRWSESPERLPKREKSDLNKDRKYEIYKRHENSRQDSERPHSSSRHESSHSKNKRKR